MGPKTHCISSAPWGANKPRFVHSTKVALNCLIFVYMLYAITEVCPCLTTVFWFPVFLSLLWFLCFLYLLYCPCFLSLFLIQFNFPCYNVLVCLPCFNFHNVFPEYFISWVHIISSFHSIFFALFILTISFHMFWLLFPLQNSIVAIMQSWSEKYVSNISTLMLFVPL